MLNDYSSTHIFRPITFYCTYMDYYEAKVAVSYVLMQMVDLNIMRLFEENFLTNEN